MILTNSHIASFRCAGEFDRHRIHSGHRRVRQPPSGVAIRDYTTKNLVQLIKTNSRILSFLALSRLFEQKSLVIRTEGGRREKVLELPSDRRHGSRDCLHPNAVIERTA